MFQWIRDRVAAVNDEILARIKAVWECFRAGLRSFWHGRGGWTRRLFDLTAALCIAILAPPLVIALSAANFVDGTDTMTAVVTALIAYLVLEFLALWFMEILVVLAALQLSRLSNRYLFHVERRKAKRCSTSSSANVSTSARGVKAS